MAFEHHQRTSCKALRVPAGVMWQSEAPLNPGRHPQRLTTKLKPHCFCHKRLSKESSPRFLAIIQGFAESARIVIRDHGPAIWDTATHLGEVRLERQAPCKSA
jgi:hypothetical protein